MLAELSAAHADALARHLPRALALVRGASPGMAVALAVAGLLLLVVGARWRRPVALVGGLAAGALVGWVLKGVAFDLLHVRAGTSVAAGALVIALGAVAFPQLFPIALGAAVGGVVGLRLPLGFPIAGAVAGALALAAAAVLGARVLAALVAAGIGAALLVAGLVALAPTVPTDVLASHPLVALGIAVVLAIAGAAAQVEHAWGEGGGKAAPRRAEAPSRAESE